ncbi:acyltransferase [Alcanivoracaceae bacterium MT1]
MNSGRELYSKLRVVIEILKKIIAVLPAFLANFALSLLSSGRSKPSIFLRYLFFSRVLRTLGESVYFGEYVIIRNPRGVSLGDSVSIHPLTYIDGYGEVNIGNYVSIAHNSSILSFEHQWGNAELPIKYNPVKSFPVVIEDDVWIGCGVRVLAGSYIESRVIVAAGSVVKGRLESGWIYGGVPARKLKQL